MQPPVQQQYPQQQPYPPQGYYPPPQPPREIVTTTGMGAGEAAFHWTMIICTCGFWWPVYAARRRKANRTAVSRYR